jgi:hypothetical protein
MCRYDGSCKFAFERQPSGPARFACRLCFVCNRLETRRVLGVRLYEPLRHGFVPHEARDIARSHCKMKVVDSITALPSSEAKMVSSLVLPRAIAFSTMSHNAGGDGRSDCATPQSHTNCLAETNEIRRSVPLVRCTRNRRGEVGRASALCFAVACDVCSSDRWICVPFSYPQHLSLSTSEVCVSTPKTMRNP